MDKDNKIALLIDAENVSSKYIKLIMDEVSDFGVATYKRIYGDFTQQHVSSWLNKLQDHAITPVFQNNYTKGKNASDFALIIDAMDILYSGNVEGFCIVSSDSDFTKLAMRLRESGMKVIGMGEKKTPNSLVSACETFKFLDVIYKEDEGNEKEKEKLVVKEPKVVSVGEKDKEEEIDNIPSKEDIEKEIISIMTSKAGDDGWLNLAEIGNNLFKRIPGFDPRNYECLKLRQLIESFDSLEVRSVDNPHNNMLKIVYVRIK